MFCRFYENRLFRTDVFNDVAITKMLQKPCVLQPFFMVEAKTIRESRQHRLHKIVTTLARELPFFVVHLKSKIFVLRVRLVKRMLFEQFQASEVAIQG